MWGIDVNVAGWVLVPMALYLSAYVAYWVLLLSAHLVGRRTEPGYADPRTRFGVLVPAHNEELLLPDLLASLARQSYPSEMFRVIVVADNCVDSTAAIARREGVMVLERHDLLRRGKGYAIEFAMKTLNASDYDALFIVDADSVVGEGALRYLDGMIQGGSCAIQCYNGVGNADQSWFTRILDVSRTIGNEIYHPAKQRLGLSSYLMGNGMCFTEDLLMRYGWDSFSVGEDWEYYAKLVMRGEIISFGHGARVYHRESSTLKQATSQRLRWSSGRFAIAWRYGFRLLWAGISERNMIKADSATPLLFPNPSLGVNIALAGLGASLLVRIGEVTWLSWWFGVLIAFQVIIFVWGIYYCQNRASRLVAIAVAPAFLVWKLLIDIVSALGIGRREWVRTKRER